MKNVPERIYLDLGVEPSENDDFDVCDDVTWSETNATGLGIEYVRIDLIESFFMWKSKYAFTYKKNDNGNVIKKDICSLFTEFINSRKVQKE